MMGKYLDDEIDGVLNVLEKSVRALASLSRGMGRQELGRHAFYLV